MVKIHCKNSACRKEVNPAKIFWGNGNPYCSKQCQEYVALLRVVKAARSQSPWYIVLAVIATLFTMALTSYLTDANAHDIYTDWVNGVNGGSCCNGRMEKDGTMTGDCYPTKAKWSNGHWWAFIITSKTWIEVPDDRIVNYETPDFSAHLCYSDLWQSLYCFRPPKPGM